MAIKHRFLIAIKMNKKQGFYNNAEDHAYKLGLNNFADLSVED